ncbi:hypothetical protein GUITHDRAFT_119915 [Guillardia theta CCMP2712]|uniref:Uncharacterized protein n=2 Tax=Guillardia theta TaxID=55529 RepID=L1ID85_GUITC|nr:hypothetical protein GUITHDRAFT_119915 [Guillardia theta CCMP2712]EKX33869.1 hypothetical protein GUITHDRAFT_119915 [Guillardia theta CCMP2712]|eukprot:XP_005820849.1 hypothetical protein GUITHDRAFT_119915 [Guillardia theta CCMP2712]
MANPVAVEAVLRAAEEERNMVEALHPLHPSCRAAVMQMLRCELGDERTSLGSMHNLTRVSWLAIMQSELPWPRGAVRLLLDTGNSSSCAMLFHAVADMSVLEQHRSGVRSESVSRTLAECMLVCEEFASDEERGEGREEGTAGNRPTTARGSQDRGGRSRMRAEEGGAVMRLMVGALIRHVELNEEDGRNERVFGILRDAVRMFRQDLKSHTLQGKDALFPEPVQKLLALLRGRQCCDVSDEFATRDVQACRNLLQRYLAPLRDGEKSLPWLFDAGWESLQELFVFLRRYFDDDLQGCNLFRSPAGNQDLRFSGNDSPREMLGRILGVQISVVKAVSYKVSHFWHEILLPRDVFCVLHHNYNPSRRDTSAVSTRDFETCRSVCDGHFQVFFSKDLSFPALVQRAICILCLYSFLGRRGGGGREVGGEVRRREEGVELDETSFLSLVEWIAEEASHNLKQQFCLWYLSLQIMTRLSILSLGGGGSGGGGGGASSITFSSLLSCLSFKHARPDAPVMGVQLHPSLRDEAQELHIPQLSAILLLRLLTDFRCVQDLLRRRRMPGRGDREDVARAFAGKEEDRACRLMWGLVLSSKKLARVVKEEEMKVRVDYATCLLFELRSRLFEGEDFMAETFVKFHDDRSEGTMRRTARIDDDDVMFLARQCPMMIVHLIADRSAGQQREVIFKFCEALDGEENRVEDGDRMEEEQEERRRGSLLSLYSQVDDGRRSSRWLCLLVKLCERLHRDDGGTVRTRQVREAEDLFELELVGEDLLLDDEVDRKSQQIEKNIKACRLQLVLWLFDRILFWRSSLRHANPDTSSSPSSSSSSCFSSPDRLAMMQRACEELMRRKAIIARASPAVASLLANFQEDLMLARQNMRWTSEKRNKRRREEEEEDGRWEELMEDDVGEEKLRSNGNATEESSASKCIVRCHVASGRSSWMNLRGDVERVCSKRSRTGRGLLQEILVTECADRNVWEVTEKLMLMKDVDDDVVCDVICESLKAPRMGRSVGAEQVALLVFLLTRGGEREVKEVWSRFEGSCMHDDARRWIRLLRGLVGEGMKLKDLRTEGFWSRLFNLCEQSGADLTFSPALSQTLIREVVVRDDKLCLDLYNDDRRYLHHLIRAVEASPQHFAVYWSSTLSFEEGEEGEHDSGRMNAVVTFLLIVHSLKTNKMQHVGQFLRIMVETLHARGSIIRLCRCSDEGVLEEETMEFRAVMDEIDLHAFLDRGVEFGDDMDNSSSFSFSVRWYALLSRSSLSYPVPLDLRRRRHQIRVKALHAASNMELNTKIYVQLAKDALETVRSLQTEEEMEVLLRLVASAGRAALQQGSLSAKMWKEWMRKMRRKVVCILAGYLRKSGKQEQEATLSWPCVRRCLVVLAACSCSSDGHDERGAAEEEEGEEEQEVEESMAVLATQVITMGMKKLARSDDQDCWRAIAGAADLLVEDVKQQDETTVRMVLARLLGFSSSWLLSLQETADQRRQEEEQRKSTSNTASLWHLLEASVLKICASRASLARAGASEVRKQLEECLELEVHSFALLARLLSAIEQIESK